jgi:hypothetical protein
LSPLQNTRKTEQIEPDRQGFTLVEVAAAAVLMTALLLMLGQAVGWVAVARRAADRRQAALLEATGVLEQITATPFAAINADASGNVELSKAARDLLGEDALEVDVQSVADEPAAKRVVVGVRYSQPGETPVTSIHLVTWVFMRGAR